MSDYLEELKDIIFEGVALDIFRADQCISMLNAIGTSAKFLNNQGFGDVFGSMQGYLTEHVVLSITKIFEKPTRYPIRSIPRALDILEKNSEIITITDHQTLINRLSKWENQISIDNKTDSELTILLVSILRQETPSVHTDTLMKMNALKTMRDKQIAHHEATAVENIEKVTWDEIDSILRFAKSTVGVIGKVYLELSYESEDGEYHLTGRAKRSGIALNRLFKKANLIETRGIG